MPGFPLLRRKPPSSFTCSRHWTSRGERLSFLRESDFNGLFLSLIRKLLVISFFYAVLINGQTWIPAIVNSFAELGATAAGVPLAQNPSDIMTQGLQIISDLFTKISATELLTQPGGAITTILAACIVLASYIIITLTLRRDQTRSHYRDVCRLYISWIRREPLDFALF